MENENNEAKHQKITTFTPPKEPYVPDVRAAYEHLRRIFEACGDGSGKLDSGWAIAVATKAMEALSEGIESLPTAQIVDPEDLKSIWQRLNSQTPEGCKLSIFFKSHYGVFGPESYLAGQEYSGQDWSAYLNHKEIPDTCSVGGTGKTPEEAMTNAVADFYSKMQRINARELSEFKEWRAARERRGKRHLPYDKEGWDKAVGGKRK